MIINEDFLRSDHFFKGLHVDHLKLIADCSGGITFNANQFIARDGEDANYFYMIKQGSIAIEMFAPQQGTLIIQTLKPGDILGWSWLFPPYKWQFDTRAMEPVEAIMFDGRCIRQKCETDYLLGYELMKRFAEVMVQRLNATRIQLLDLYCGHREGGENAA